MLKRIFSFSNATLLVALTLSTIAAWYSIIGLTAIFAGAVIPIIIMGSALELGKIVTTVWLRKYWYRCSMIMKLYLVPAVFFLAVLTSMGIFGFLSKAHMDQGLVSGDAVAQVSLYDEKISVQKDIVKSSKAMLAQMDQQVNDIMTKGDSERSVERSVAIRKQQAKERASLQKDIESANREIQALNELRAPLAAETRKIEAEVGPIKYIAALIYGDNPDQNVLERAVRWVIIMLVAVFDPLALVLVVAANQSKEWDEHIEEELERKEEVEHEKVMADLEEEEEDDKPVVWQGFVMNPSGARVEEDLTDINHELAENAVVTETVIDEPKVEEPVVEQSVFEKHPYLTKPFVHFANMKPMTSSVKEFEEPVVEVIEEEQVPEVESTTQNPESPILAFGIDVVERPGDYVNEPQFEGVKVNGEWVQTGPEFETLPEKIGDEYVMYKGKPTHLHALRGSDPDMFGLVTDTLPNVDSGFGATFPEQAKLGDVFVRTDSIPHRTFKFNGNTWILAPQTSAHLSNENYLHYLVQKISTGEYDPELLNEDQQDAIEAHITKHG